MRRTPFNSLSFVSSFRRSSVTAAHSSTRIVADFSLWPRIEIPRDLPHKDIVVLKLPGRYRDCLLIVDRNWRRGYTKTRVSKRELVRSYFESVEGFE
jgi:hypothetical protein